jgi:hypothetical protein
MEERHFAVVENLFFDLDGKLDNLSCPTPFPGIRINTYDTKNDYLKSVAAGLEYEKAPKPIDSIKIKVIRNKEDKVQVIVGEDIIFNEPLSILETTESWKDKLKDSIIEKFRIICIENEAGYEEAHLNAVCESFVYGISVFAKHKGKEVVY